MKTHSNMEIFGKVWPVMILLLWFIKKTGCQSQGYCGHAVPVVKVCTKDSVMSQKNVSVDTASAPRLQIITCECEMSSSRINETFLFVYSDNTDHAWFEVNTHKVLENHTENIYDKADLLFLNTNDSFDVKGCLKVNAESGANFSITCLPKPTDTTTDSVKPRTSYSSGGISSVTEGVVEPDGNREPKTDIIIPIVATTISVVCLAGVVALVVVCRRRSFADKQKSKTSTSVVKKEKEDEYYMTENPMYDATDGEQNIPSAESEYHYIEAENEGVSMPDNQYEYMPDSPVTGHFPGKRNDLHYDYTTCASSKGKNGPVLAQNVKQNNIEDMKVREQESKLITGDTMYHRTDTAGAKTFLSVNDYHHISPAASRKRAEMNTYNTCEEAKST